MEKRTRRQFVNHRAQSMTAGFGALHDLCDLRPVRISDLGSRSIFRTSTSLDFGDAIMFGEPLCHHPKPGCKT